MEVKLIDSMGDDTAVVNAARVSFHKEVDEFTDKDEKLIKYLASHGHWTPFSHVQYQVRIRAPIFVARQWYKHMIGITRNEVSRRYVNEKPEFYQPDYWRKKAANKKQGSDGKLITTKEAVQNKYEALMKGAARTYRRMLELGLCEEQARIVLPQSMYTEWIETGSLVAAARIVKQRTEEHAQHEIQLLANSFADAVQDIAPVSWKYLMKG